MEGDLEKRVDENIGKGLAHDMYYALDVMFLWKNKNKYGELSLTYRDGKIIEVNKTERERVFGEKPESKSTGT